MKIYYESKPGELEHGLFGFGTKKLKKDVKYLKKIPDGKGGFRYIYTQKELDAYNKNLANKRSNSVQKRQDSIAAKRDEAHNATKHLTQDAAKYQKEADKYGQLVETRTQNIKDIEDKLAKEKRSLRGILNTKKSLQEQEVLELIKAFDEWALPSNIRDRDTNLRNAKEKYDERDKTVNDILRGERKKKKKK